MRDRNSIGTWIRRFLLEHLVAERNLAHNTQESYRDTLALLMPYVSSVAKVPIDRLAVETVTPQLVRHFLEHIETARGCSRATRNQRLGAIHSLAKFVGTRSPEHIGWCTEICGIPFKKTDQRVVDYLDKAEMDALLAVPDVSTRLGLRNYALLLFLYNTGARANEVAHLIIDDLELDTPPSARVKGKGAKTRCCPLWPITVARLKTITDGRPRTSAVFMGRTGKPLTRFGIYNLVRETALEASRGIPTLTAKRVGPHTIRHTTAVHLLRAGVDINTIRAWLGHVSLDTTHIYAEVDLDSKARALSHCDISQEQPSPCRRTPRVPDLMTFLKAL